MARPTSCVFSIPLFFLNSKIKSPFYGTITVKFPGSITVMTPAQEQIKIDDLSRAGAPWTSTGRARESQGVTGTGTQGMGVPIAAITAGFKGEVQSPNGIIFLRGATSVIFPININSAMTVRSGVTIKGVGIIPKEHLMTEVKPTTAKLILQSP
jgi:hypothetical protein